MHGAFFFAATFVSGYIYLLGSKAPDSSVLTQSGSMSMSGFSSSSSAALAYLRFKRLILTSSMIYLVQEG